MNDVTRKSDTWIATQRATIGGSNAAAAVGLNAYKSPTSLFYEMVNGTAQDLSTNPDVLRGLLLEPVARQRLSQVLSVDVIDHDQDLFLRNEKYPWSHALPDGFVLWEGERIPIEIKVPNPVNWNKLDESVPDYILCQAVHNCTVIGAPALLLAALNPVTMEIYRNIYTPEPDAVAALMEAEEKFWNNYIVPRIPPDPVTHDDLRLRWPNHTKGKVSVATDDISHAHAKLRGLKEDAKHLAKNIDELSFEIKAHMEDSEILESAEGACLATYKSHVKETLDAKRLLAEAPVIHANYTKKQAVRMFLLK